MAREYTPHQRRLIRDFYRNRGAIEAQRLQELVTEIYLAGTGPKAERLWQRAADILTRTEGLPPERATAIVDARDVEALAELASGL
jgi:hypothetical protein